MIKSAPKDLAVLSQVDKQFDTILGANREIHLVLDKAFRFLLREIKIEHGFLFVQAIPFLLGVNPLEEWRELFENPDEVDNYIAGSGRLKDANIRLIRDGAGVYIGYMVLQEQKLTKLQTNILNLADTRFTNAVNHWLKTRNPSQSLLNPVSDSTLLEGLGRKWALLLGKALNADAYGIVYRCARCKEMMIKKTLLADDGWRYQVAVEKEGGLLTSHSENLNVLSYPDLKQEAAFDPIADGLPNHRVNATIIMPIGSVGQLIGQLFLIRLDENVQPFSIHDLNVVERGVSVIANSLITSTELEALRQSNQMLENLQRDLTNSRNILRGLIDNLPQSLYIIDVDFKVLAINFARAKRLNEDPRNLVGKTCYMALFNRDTPCEGCLAKYSFISGHPTRRAWVEEKGEGAIDWDINTYAIQQEKTGMREVILVEKDVTEEHKIEHALLQSEKLAAVGQLAAGVAHEINNPLTAVLANTQLLQRELPSNTEWHEMLELIYRAGSQALISVKNLLNLARDDDFECVDVNLNDSLERTLSIVKHELNAKNIQLKFTPFPGDLAIQASPSHLQSVWLNLILNAVDAMQGKKRALTISIQDLSNKVNVNIADTGAGISTKDLSKVFEPFYSTKNRERGTGLGLPISLKIIQQHGGSIFVTSKQGAGSKFTVTLPKKQILE